MSKPKIDKEDKKETTRDRKIHNDLINRLKAKGLVLVKGVWQKTNKK